MMAYTLAALDLGGDLVPLAAVALGCMVAMVAIISGTASRTARNKEREKTRREIAAYVAEGTITPEYGERLMAAGESPKKGCCL